MESTKIFQNFGIDLGKGEPFAGIWDDDAERRAMQALEETRKKLEQLGLLEGSNLKYVVEGDPDYTVDDPVFERDRLRHDIRSETVKILEKWGFGGNGIIPGDSDSWDDETRRRAERAFEDVKKKLESLGLYLPDDWDLHKDGLHTYDIANQALPK
jgi:sugar phosphate isomerase/epimerase